MDNFSKHDNTTVTLTISQNNKAVVKITELMNLQCPISAKM